MGTFLPLPTGPDYVPTPSVPTAPTIVGDTSTSYSSVTSLGISGGGKWSAINEGTSILSLINLMLFFQLSGDEEDIDIDNLMRRIK